MDKNRLWIIGSVLAMVVVVVLGWLVGIQPQLDAISADAKEQATVEATNAGHAALLAKLKEDFKDVDKLNAELASLDASVPAGTEIPAFADQLDALAVGTQVTLSGITVADAQPYTPVMAPLAPAPATAADSGSAPTPDPSATSAPVPTAGVPPVTNAKISADNFAAIAVQITVKGGYANVLNFVNGLQTGARLFLVTGLTTAASTDYPGAVEANISGLIYARVTPAPASAG